VDDRSTAKSLLPMKDVNIYLCPEWDSNPRFDHSEAVSATVSSLLMLVTCVYRSSSAIYLKQYNKLADVYRMAQESLVLVGNMGKHRVSRDFCATLYIDF
jgi:hypothetical protein